MGGKLETYNFSFDVDAKEHSIRNAYWLARMSEIVYQHENEVKAVFAKWGFPENDCNCFGFDRKKVVADSMKDKQYSDILKYDPQVFVAGRSDMIILTFRGTEPQNMRDWSTDAEISKIPVSGLKGEVHKGFSNALDAIWNDVWDYVRTIRDKYPLKDKCPLWITGHSLGGALAVLATAKLLTENGGLVNGLYTFGQPRVGDAVFAQYFNSLFESNTFRYVNNNDIVPRILFRFWNYSDVGILNYFDEHGKLQSNVSPESDEIIKLEDLLRNNLALTNELCNALKDISDHSMGLLEKTKKILEIYNKSKDTSSLEGFRFDEIWKLIKDGISDHGKAEYVSCLYKMLQ